MPERKQKKGVKIFNLSYLDGVEISVGIQRLKQEASEARKEGFTNIRFDQQYSYSEDESDKTLLVGDRLESEEEALKRETQEKAVQQMREAQERADYARLKEKFG